MATTRCLKRASTTPRQARKHVAARIESESANVRITKRLRSALRFVNARHREKHPSRTRRPTRARARAEARRASRARLPEAAHPRKQSLFATISRRMRSRAVPDATRLLFARAFSRWSNHASKARASARRRSASNFASARRRVDERARSSAMRSSHRRNAGASAAMRARAMVAATAPSRIAARRHATRHEPKAEATDLLRHLLATRAAATRRRFVFATFSNQVSSALATHRCCMRAAARISTRRVRVSAAACARRASKARLEATRRRRRANAAATAFSVPRDADWASAAAARRFAVSRAISSTRSCPYVRSRSSSPSVHRRSSSLAACISATSRSSAARAATSRCSATTNSFATAPDIACSTLVCSLVTSARVPPAPVPGRSGGRE